MIRRAPFYVFLSISALLLVGLLSGCVDAPKGITVESTALKSGPIAPWVNPDTVSVLVTGKSVRGTVRWDSPSEKHQEWLKENGYEKLRVEKTRELREKRLRALQGLIGREHIKEEREAVVRELSRRAIGRDELLGIDVSDGFDAEHFQKRLEETLDMRGATRAEVKKALESPQEAFAATGIGEVGGRAYYVRAE